MRVSQSSGGWETQAQGAASLVSGESPLPGCVLMWQEECELPSDLFSRGH